MAESEAGTAARLDAFAIRDFRNLERIEIELPAAGMLVVGENGQGKTNFLEAIYYLQLLRSVRGARDQDLVRFGAAGFHLGARVASDRVSQIGIGFERAGRRKRVRLDGVVSDRLGAFGGWLAVEPERGVRISGSIPLATAAQEGISEPCPTSAR